MQVRRLAQVLVVATLTGVLAGVLGGCSGTVGRDDIRSSGGSLTGITVSGVPGSAPAVRIAAPLEFGRTRSQTVVEGTGAVVVVDQLLVLQLTMYDARTGKKAISTYDDGQRAMAVKNTDGSLFPVLSDALVGLKQGSRLVMAVTAEDGYGVAGAPQYGIDPGDPLVLVADVIAVPPTEVLERAEGTPAADRPGRPEVIGDPPTDVQVAGRRPGRLSVTRLIEGTGPPVREDSLITVRSLSQVWGAADPFDDSYGKEPALIPVGTGAVVRAWDEALVGVPRGSRVLIVAPPRFAFGVAGSPPAVPGNATIVYVIDVLGVS